MDKRIPVVVTNDMSETRKILSALRNYGIFCAEITFRTPCAEDAIKLAVEEFPGYDDRRGDGDRRGTMQTRCFRGREIHRFPRDYQRRSQTFAEKSIFRIIPAA